MPPWAARGLTAPVQQSRHGPTTIPKWQKRSYASTHVRVVSGRATPAAVKKQKALLHLDVPGNLATAAAPPCVE